MTEIILALVGGVAAGSLGAWLIARVQAGALQRRQRELETELAGERERRVRAETTLEAERRIAEERKTLLTEAEKNFRDAFRALSAEALESSNRRFLELANTSFERYRSEARNDLEQREKAVESLVKPLADGLQRYESHLREVEEKRGTAYGALTEQVKSLLREQERLRFETGKLSDALRRPEVRGRWGEIQLRNVVEMAGMLEHCDFLEQQSTAGEAGQLRPDMVVKLPGGRRIVVDAKTPINAYLESLDASSDGEREERLTAFGRHVKDQVRNLGRKDYWKQFEDSPDLVVLFLPGEVFYTAALRVDPGLIEEGMANRVVLAAPTTLIVLLRIAALGWREERLAENARRISDLGRELHSRLATLSEHFVELGRTLQRSVESYNRAIGSLESRVLVTARRFADLGAGSEKEIPPAEPLDVQPRMLELPEDLNPPTTQ
ncbi:MAG: DNA recombination protein RmuC [Candidatus Latescibacterota bacterium]